MSDEEVIGQESYVEQPTEDEQAVNQEEAAASDASGDDSTAEQSGKSGVQERINELTRKWRTTERELDYWRNQAMSAQQPQQPTAQVQQPQGKPNPDDFDDYDQYLDKLADWKFQEKLNDYTKQQKQTQEQQRQQNVATQFAMRAEQFKQQNPDFEMVAYTAPISDAVSMIIAESELGPQIAFTLGKNHDEARRISSLPVVSAAREIGKLEAKLSIPPPKTTTQAPDPIQTVDGSETARKDPAKMTPEEYRDWRWSQKR